MKRHSLALLAFALVPSRTPAGTCTVAIATDPPGASIVVDALPPASTPWSGPLAAGSHRAAISLAGWSDTTAAFACDSQAVALAVRLRRSKVWTDSVRAARADSLARARRDYARQTLSNASDDLPAALDRLGAAVKRDSGQVLPLAVLPFQSVGGAGPDAAAMASETAVLQLSRDPRWKLVERERFQSVLQEQALWGSGVTTSDLEIGRALEARYLLSGTVTVDGLRRLVAMRLIDAVDGRVVAASAAKVDGPAMDAALQDALGEKFGVSGAVFRSLVMPGWGQFWTDRPVRGSLWLAAAAGLTGTFAWSVADWADKDNVAEDFKNKDASTFHDGESTGQWLARANKAVADRNDAADRNLLIGSALAATWALNVADAAWCGYRSSRSARSRYFAFAPVVTPDAAGLRVSFSLGGTAP